ncbi:penicillin-binding protein [Virgibacillus salinus]|uniref:serine-type D-Ala-D-Ala carboxypeptidase n=1 Tax=Virgibacillus salinus TaxID=553311 RepID=A0A1H1CFW5_9BACI|nr:penicillin-binding protein [Virgibacillus salinus]SDQ63054.1 penicillin-binding protein 2B [Virgibacillus salinus]
MKKNKTTHFMSSILILIFVGIFLIIAGRFLYIQATAEINNVSLDEWAKEKRTASYTLDAERGKIFDKNGMTLAYDRPTFRIQAIVDESYTQDQEEPLHVKNPEETAEMLAPLLDTEQGYLLERLEKGIKKDQFQVEFGNVGKELSQQTKEKIENLNLSGITFQKEAVRFYPNGMFASNIIGFARKKDGKINGVTGIENEMDDLLSGEAGHISYQRDNFNKKLLDPNEVIKQPEDGEDVYLTIDQKVQTILEDVMTQVDKEYKPERITAVVMNPKTGEVLAMGNRPSYNPNNPNVKNWYNDVISTPFEPGSTMKIFTWASAIQEGVYNGDKWLESSSYQISDNIAPIHDWSNNWGSITFDEGFARSSNVAAAKLVWEEIGTEKYLDYLNAFDFDQKTGIDLPHEAAGNLVYNYPRDKMATGFGQASTVTPIQQMKAATAIANDGKMLKPYVISKIVNSTTGKTMEKKSPEVVGNPISEKTSEQVLDLMESVVSSEPGTGRPYKLEDYSVAGKTGTAQLYESEAGGYLTGHGNYIFSFLGMAPKDDPQLMMYVSVEKPELEGNTPGSTPVSFIFKNVMQNSLHYMNINPDKDQSKPVQSVKVPELEGMSKATVKKSLEAKGINITVIGSGDTITKASAAKGDELLPNDRIMLITDNPTMPSIIGWSTRDVLQFANLLQLDIEILGNGYVNSQSIKKGTTLKKNDYLGVELKPPKSKNNNSESNEEQTEEQTDDSSDQQ